jgi:plasmid rolling circle replication initiator protein Rep
MKNISAEPADVKPDEKLKEEIEKLTKHKRGAMTLAYTYEKTDLPWRFQWAEMLKYCGNRVIYGKDPDSGEWGIIAAMFCQKRLCPLCSWRRTVRVGRNIYWIIESPEFKKVQFIFLTMTVKNCSGGELPGVFDRIIEAWNVLTRTAREPFRRSFLGTFRSVEITYDRDEYITPQKYKRAKKHYDSLGLKVGDKNPTYQTYHPHIHVLAAVSPGYFRKSNQDYISHEALRKIWTSALNRAVWIAPAETVIRELDRDTFGARLDLGPGVIAAMKTIREKYPPIDYAPQVRIEKIKNSTGKAVAEVGKYVVKPADYIDLPEVVQVLDPALRHRRLIAYGGLFKEVRDRLRLEDEQIAEEDFPQVTAQELLRNPLIKKVMLNWTFQGAYKITPYQEKNT